MRGSVVPGGGEEEVSVPHVLSLAIGLFISCFLYHPGVNGRLLGLLIQYQTGSVIFNSKYLLRIDEGDVVILAEGELKICYCTVYCLQNWSADLNSKRPSHGLPYKLSLNIGSILGAEAQASSLWLYAPGQCSL